MNEMRDRMWFKLSIVGLLAVLLPLGSTLLTGDTLVFAYPDADVPYEMMTTLSGAKIEFSSPALADLDHDAYLEIVVGGIDGRVYAVKPDQYAGTLLWSFDTKTALNAVANHTSNTTIRGAITVADLDNDGWQEIIVPVGTVSAAEENGGVVVLRHDGTLMPGWPQLTYNILASEHTEGVGKAPVVADLDADGDLEIIVGAFDMRIHAWHHDGTPVDGWPQFVYDTVWSSPVVADLNKDGFPEVIVGTDAHNDPYHSSINGGALYVFNADGTLFGNFPKYFNEIFNSAPAIADLNADGYVDIVIGGGNFWDGTDGYKVHAIDRSGNYLPGWPKTTGGHVVGSPALADIDNNGDLEIVVGSRDTKLYAWHHNGTAVSGFPMTPKIFNGVAYAKSSVIVADLDRSVKADGKLEIYFNSGWEVVIVDSAGQQITFDGTSGSDSYRTPYTLSALPVVGDVDNDGTLELVAGGASSGGTNAAVYVWQLADSTAAAGASDWPAFKHDVARSGIVPKVYANDAAVVRHTVPDHWFPGADFECEVVLRNTGASTWTAGASYRLGIENGAVFGLASRIELPAGASIAPGMEVTFTFTLKTPVTGGFYPFGVRMVHDGVEWFGPKINREVKVGDQPALYVLYANNSLPGGGVQPGGLAAAISPPPGYSMWSNATSFALTHDGAGYYLSDGPGGYVTWGGTAEDVGSIVNVYGVQLVISPDGEGYYLLNDNGVVERPSTSPTIEPDAPTFTDHRMRSLAVTPDAAGIYTLDKYGNVYRGGVAPALSPATPIFADGIALRIRLTPDAGGHYVLDRYGRVHSGGNAPAISPNYTPRIGEDWARDFALTEDGMGYYLLDKYGNIHTGGSAEPLTVNLPPVAEDAAAIGLEVADSRVMDFPYLALNSDAVWMMSEFGGALPSSSVTLWNGGTEDVLTWTAAVVSGGSWLSVSPPSGTTPATLRLGVTTPQPIGVYHGIVRLTATIPIDDSVVEKDITVTWRVVETLHNVYLPLSLKQ